MKKTVSLQIGAFTLATVLAWGAVFITANAHGDEVHETTAHAEDADATTSTEVAKLEHMITLLNQLIVLMKTLRMEQAYTPAPAPAPAVSSDSAEMDMHHDMHAHETNVEVEIDDASAAESEKRLIIEIEPHNGKTHAHVRYVDKPEDMFFVESDIDDEDGVVSAIHERTGLSEEEIREALTYLGS